MLRSLVGSEMCIRDSINAEYGKDVRGMGNGESSAHKEAVAEGESFIPVATEDSLTGTRDFLASTVRDSDTKSGAGIQWNPFRLPHKLMLRVTATHIEFWKRSGNEISGSKPHKTLSYFNVLGWGFSPKVFRMIEFRETMNEHGFKIKNRKVLEFETLEGEAIVDMISRHCKTISREVDSHARAKKCERDLRRKDKAWEDYKQKDQVDEQTSTRTRTPVQPVQDSRSPLSENTPASLVPDMSVDFTQMDLPQMHEREAIAA
eukprot:TRINITY_DN3855_c0_g1_i1.p1 TRINITY_DN3855_c0_g1~~TRINITY_DN3855_c0_g1_i1.p1  ORF type:complete len:292 (-),score=87.06 TRINITY_DN3855_c0_g1_i1:212-994(-)